MCKIILPIKPKYAKALLDGNKIFEIRRKAPKKDVDEIIIYETSPTSLITGILKIKETHRLRKSDLWELTKNKNLLTRKEFDNYIGDLEYGYAFEVESRKNFSKKMSLEKYNLKYPPQGFVYWKK